MTIKLLLEDIRIRPSSIDNFCNCSYQWGKTFLEGLSSIPNARAAIGTSIHKGAEVFWQDAMRTGKKDTNFELLADAAVEAWKEETHDGVKFDDGEDHNTAIKEIVRGTEAFVTDIAEFTPIPNVVEHFLKIDLSHPLVKELGGTIDYYCRDQQALADVKTSKRKPTVSNYTTQQSVYKMLAEANDMPVKHNLIQSIVLGKTSADGSVVALTPNMDQAKYLVNNMLDTLEVVSKDIMPIHYLLRGNPKYYLCSEKYCAHYATCPFVKGEDIRTEPKKVVKL